MMEETSSGQGTDLVGTNDFSRTARNATSLTGMVCPMVYNGSLSIELNCTEAYVSKLYTFWSRQKFIDWHLGSPTRNEAYSNHFRYANLAQTVFAFNATRTAGGGQTGNVSVRGELAAWPNGAGQDNLTFMLWNTSQFIKNQTEFESFAASGVDALLICSGVGCNVGAPYQSNGSFLYETDFRFGHATGYTTDASRIGKVDSEFDKFMNPLEDRFTSGAWENRTGPQPPGVNPNPTILDPANASYTKNNLSLNATANETFDQFWYDIGNGINVSFAPNATILPADGFHNLTVCVNGSTGNTKCAQLNFTVTNFNLTIFLPANTTYNAQNRTLTETSNRCGNGVDRMWYILNSGPNVSFAACSNTTFLAAEGTNNLTVYANKTGPNNLTSFQVNFTIKRHEINLTLALDVLFQNSTYEYGSTIIINATSNLSNTPISIDIDLPNYGTNVTSRNQF